MHARPDPRSARAWAAPAVTGGGVVEAYATFDQEVANGRSLRILLVWGVRFTRECIAQLLESDPLATVVGQCANLSEATALSLAAQADIVLLDGRIPEGTAAVRRALDIAPEMRVVVCSVSEAEDEVIAWAEAGVIGYIPQTAALADFVRLIVDIHSGEQVSSGRVVTGLLRRIALTARWRPRRETELARPALTKRERQAAELIRTGLSDKEIARQLNISLATTKSHVHNLLGKLQVQRRSQVAEYLRAYSQS